MGTPAPTYLVWAQPGWRVPAQSRTGACLAHMDAVLTYICARFEGLG